MPTMFTLRKPFQGVRLEPRFNETYSKILAKKVATFSKLSTLCTISFDEISIRFNV